MSGALLGFVGDVIVERDQPATAFATVAEPLADLDYLFGNLESPYTTRPRLAPSALIPVHVDPANAVALGAAGFSALSLANNHILDAGIDVMLDTAQLVRAQGVAVCGVGAEIRAARQPAVVRRAGRQIACLAYASVFPMGYEARTNWPGLAPMRAHTLYLGTANHWIPGEIPRVRTVPLEEDLRALQEDIALAAAESDVVIASFHWGDWTRPFVLTDHERRTARQAIDAGADVVVGHHHHALRGIEWYRGRPIFYGLGHFVFDAPLAADRAAALGAWADSPATAPTTSPGPDDADPGFGRIAAREGWPSLPFHPDMRMTALAWCRVDDSGAITAGFLPCVIRPDGNVHPCDPDSSDGRRVTDYLRTACAVGGSSVRLHPDPDTRLGGLPTIRVVDDPDIR